MRVLQGRVREVHYLGAYSEYVVDAGGGVIRVHAGADIGAGSQVVLPARNSEIRGLTA
jgi:iron(III) transport system ATP-binding protein